MESPAIIALARMGDLWRGELGVSGVWRLRREFVRAHGARYRAGPARAVPPSSAARLDRTLDAASRRVLVRIARAWSEVASGAR